MGSVILDPFSGNLIKMPQGLGSSDSPTFAGAYLANVYLNQYISINGADTARATIVGSSNNSVTSIMNLNNPSTGTSAGSGLLISAGAASSFVGGVGCGRTDAASNSLLSFRVLSNGSLTAAGAAAPIYIQGATAGAYIGINGNIALSTTTGTAIGTAANQKLSLWGVTPNVQPTTAISGAAQTFVTGSGTGYVRDTSTIGGYTVQQIVAALKQVGILA